MKTLTVAICGFLWIVIATPSSTAAERAPDHEGVAYAEADPQGSGGHLLDIYLPEDRAGPVPVVLWSAGSAWLVDNGRTRADWLVNELRPAGFAVVGVSVRSSSQAIFPAQLHDIKAAIRFVRANAVRFGFDADRIAVVGTSSGGWVAAMAAATRGLEEVEGNVGTIGVSSAVDAAVAFFPPTDFLAMDAWALAPCENLSFRGTEGFCHDDPASPESRLVGCPIQDCPEKVKAANPITYVRPDSAPLLIVHGQSDPLVPHHQGESLYQAYNKACAESVFISVPRFGHGPLEALSDPMTIEGTTIRATVAATCEVTNPAPVDFSPGLVRAFLDVHLKD